MREGWVLALAASVALGALHPARSAFVIGLVALAVTAVWRRPVWLCLALGLLGSGLAQRALDGLDGTQAAPLTGEVTLLSDPTPSFGGLRVDVRLGGRRLDAAAQGTPADALEDRLAGEVLLVRGRVEPLSSVDSWSTSRHIGGRLTVLAVEGWRPGDPSARVANGLRRTLVEGAEPLDARAARALHRARHR